MARGCAHFRNSVVGNYRRRAAARGKTRFPDRPSTLSILTNVILDGPNTDADFRQLKGSVLVSTDTVNWVKWKPMIPAQRAKPEERGGQLVAGSFRNHSGSFDCGGDQTELTALLGRFPRYVKVRLEILPADRPAVIMSFAGQVLTNDCQDGIGPTRSR